MDNNDSVIIKQIQTILFGVEKNNNVSQQTQNAQELSKKLKEIFTGNLKLEFEVPIYKDSSLGNEKIDIVDYSTHTAYEIKYSGNNISHEFYKDVFKVLVYNQYYPMHISRFVFISESVAIEKFGESPLFEHTKEFCKKLGITVILLSY